MKKLLVLLFFCACLTAGGCATGGRDASQGTTADQNQQVYELYRQYMETLNETRQRAGVPPVYIRSYEEWRQSPGTD